MVIGIGLDLVETARVERALERFGERFVRKLMDPEEADSLPRPERERALALALAVAGKEAASKALGTGIAGGIGWTQIEVVQPGGRVPTLRLSGAALERFRAMGATRSYLTISHDGGLGVACVVLES